jgi:uncharacterized protein YndB with AHSA1/START domain
MIGLRRLGARLLSPAEASVAIDAAPEQVFAALSDPTTYPDWLAGAQRIRGVDQDFPRPGSGFDHEVGPAEAATVGDRSTSLVVDPPHRLQLEVHVGPATGIVDFLVEPADQGTLVTLRERALGPLGLAMPLLRVPLHLRNKGSLERLRQRFAPLVVRL